MKRLTGSSGRRGAVLGMALLVSGCATLMEGDAGETVMVNSLNCPEGTKCTLTNKKGTWRVKVPGAVTVKKSDDTLHMVCEGPEGVTAEAGLESEHTGWVWGNIILGGGIGGVVDANTDAHREYANAITVQCTNK